MVIVYSFFMADTLSAVFSYGYIYTICMCFSRANAMLLHTIIAKMFYGLKQKFYILLSQICQSSFSGCMPGLDRVVSVYKADWQSLVFP